MFGSKYGPSCPLPVMQFVCATVVVVVVGDGAVVVVVGGSVVVVVTGIVVVVVVGLDVGSVPLQVTAPDVFTLQLREKLPGVVVAAAMTTVGMATAATTTAERARASRVRLTSDHSMPDGSPSIRWA